MDNELTELRADLIGSLLRLQEELDDCKTKASRKRARKLTLNMEKKFKTFRKLTLVKDNK